MLTVSRTAAEVIAELAKVGAVDDHGGLRVCAATENADNTYELSLAKAPSVGDEIIAAEEGARVFLAPEAAARLAGTTLDVRTDDLGQRKFRLIRQS